MRAVEVFMLFYILTFAVRAGIVIAPGADLVTGSQRDCHPMER
jgi:hypothetical protein